MDDLTENSAAVYEDEAIRFVYPAGWTREMEESVDGTSLSLLSPGGVTFAIIGIYEEDREPGDVVDQAVESLREEHPTLEIEDLDERGWSKAVSLEAVFLSLDTLSYCWIRSWRVARRTLLVYLQTVEPEAEMAQKVFRALCKSVQPRVAAGRPTR